MLTIVACVLRLGGAYDAGHVARLQHQVQQHTPLGTSFICLTDEPERVGDAGRRLEHDWPGWFSKIELLCLPGPILYLDLDVSITGDLSPLLAAALDHHMIMCAGWWGPEDPNPLNSSVMAWAGNAPLHVYEAFLADPERHIREHTKMPGARTRWGDQGVLASLWRGSPIARWQDLLPGAVVSYKRGALMREDMSRCVVLVSHGLPRPWGPGGADMWLRRRGSGIKN